MVEKKEGDRKKCEITKRIINKKRRNYMAQKMCRGSKIFREKGKLHTVECTSVPDVTFIFELGKRYRQKY